MSRQMFATVCAAACCLLSTGDAHAILITSNGDFAVVSDQDGAAPISDIKIIAGQGSTGRIYTNQVSGAPFTVGSEIRTVSAYRIDGATDGIQHSGVEFADGDKLIIVSAILGTITSTSGGLVTADFTIGRAFAIKISAAGFDSRNPDSWDSGTIVAEFALKPKEAVVSGPLGANVSFTAAQTNQSAANSAATQQTQGVFLFREDSPQGQTPGNNLLSNVETYGIPAQFIDSESLIADVDQTLLFTDLEDWDDPTGPLGAADLAALNLFAMLAGFSDLSGGAMLGHYFASGLGGAAVTDFNPQWPQGDGGPGPNGDFFATLGIDNYVAIQASPVPEPTSVVLFGIGAGLCGLGALRRRRNEKAKTAA